MVLPSRRPLAVSCCTSCACSLASLLVLEQLGDAHHPGDRLLRVHRHLLDERRRGAEPLDRDGVVRLVVLVLLRLQLAHLVGHLMLSQLRLELLEPLRIEHALTFHLPDPLLGRDQLLALSRETFLRRRQQLVHVRATLVLGDLERAPRLDLLETAVHLRVRLCRRLQLLREGICALGGTVGLLLHLGVRPLERFSARAFLRERCLGLLQRGADLRRSPP